MAGNSTGTVGQLSVQEDLYVEGAPLIYIQRIVSGSAPLRNPDADGFYWGLSGTVSAPVIELGCYEGVTFNDNLDVNAIRCDKIGDVATVMKRNYLELSFTLKTMFPLSSLAPLLNWGTVTTVTDYEKVGIGIIDSNVYFRAWLVRMYDATNSDYVGMQFHRAQFVQNSSLNFTYGPPWAVEITLRGYGDPNMPDAQKFATVIRHDPSAL